MELVRIALFIVSLNAFLLSLFLYKVNKDIKKLKSKIEDLEKKMKVTPYMKWDPEGCEYQDINEGWNPWINGYEPKKELKYSNEECLS